MSLASALGSALSGLSVSGRLANLVSTNIANAATPGYAKREAELGSTLLGGQTSGVTITAYLRDVDAYLLNERRAASAGRAGAQAEQAFLTKLETALSGNLLSGGLSDRLATFESALIAAAARPDSESFLANVLTGAQGIVDHLNSAEAMLQSARTEADAAIADQVDQLNTALQQVQDLNTRIQVANAAGRDTSALQDLRQSQIDRIAGIIPIAQIPREGGVVALYSTQGAPLVDGRASRFDFTPTRAITADATLQNGALGGLILNGRPIGTDAVGLVEGGSLSAAFDIRDRLAPEAQARLDGVALELGLRFQATGLDGTLSSGAAGLFTDAGARADMAAEVGLAGRLRINSAVDPAQGGGIWRLRDGIGAASPGNVGQTSLLTAYHQVLGQSAAAISASLPTGSRTLAGLATDLQSYAARQRVTADEALTFAEGRLGTLQAEELLQGVDSDQELQKLLLIEQAYAANARVIQAIDSMMNTLLEL
ncbi:flagellar hook-associated protein FlgK [Gemmobacter serpentinus]|uniref:flagellar hook-associated protein FlgK n=1 Tax=Gemmobacter serpentinus TaxID=2652247 RepID=UPI00124E3F45|nr:flagellar hook-associated protein FlgK [Gemmobacter serpentinus]